MSHNSHSSHSSRHGTSTGDELGSTDEVKVFKDEGDREDEKISSENLLVEEKSSLIDLTESEEKSSKIATRTYHSPVFNKVDSHSSSFNMGYLVPPYSYSNSGAGGLPVTMANKMALPPFFCHNVDPLTTPPPAHCGIPPYQLDPKAIGLTRPAIYPFHSNQYPYPMLSPDMSQVASWHTPTVYSSASNFRSPYASSLPINTALSSDFSFRFSPSLLPSVHTSQHHMLNSHPAIVTPGPKQDIGQDNSISNRNSRNSEVKNSLNSQGHGEGKESLNEKRKSHIKKPLNAFMLYMKEMRAKVVAECTLKESAAINQILGRRWHELSREEQSKYYEKARQERQLHMELYPGWSARDNYGYVSKKKKRKKDRSPADAGDLGNNMKKCRARFGLDQQNQWCKPCRRKKKCIRYMESGGVGDNDDRDHEFDDMNTQMSEDDMGSCGSVDDAKTLDDDNESLNQSFSSPGYLSGLSSVQSPSTSIASPLNQLTSPTTPATASIAPNNDQQLLTQQHQHHQQQQQQQQLQLQQPQQQQQQQQQQLQHHHQHQQRQKHFLQGQPLSQTSTAAVAVTQQSILLKQHQNLFNQHHQQQNQKLQPQPQLQLYNNCSIANSAVATATTSVSLSTLSSLSISTSSASNCPASGSSTSISTTSSPASIADRMMLSLLNGSPSALLGNRFSHLAMGFNSTNTNGNDLQFPIQQQQPQQQAATNRKTALTSTEQIASNSLTKLKDCHSNNLKSMSTSVATSFIENDGTQPSSTLTTVLSNMATTKTPIPADTVENALTVPAATTKPIASSSSSASSAASSPAADFFFEKSTTRNPVGANPRDINNPLSINQLTKRDSGNNSAASSPSSSALVSCISSSVATSSTTTSGKPSESIGSVQSPTNEFTQFHVHQRLQHLQHLQHLQQHHHQQQQQEQHKQHNQPSSQQFQQFLQHPHSPHPHLQHPHHPHSLFTNNISQHFQQQFSHQLAAAAAAAVVSAQMPSAVTSVGDESPSTMNNNNSNTTAGSVGPVKTDAITVATNMGNRQVVSVPDPASAVSGAMNAT